jgi:hypothetical protein
MEITGGDMEEVNSQKALLEQIFEAMRIKFEKQDSFPSKMLEQLTGCIISRNLK